MKKFTVSLALLFAALGVTSVFAEPPKMTFRGLGKSDWIPWGVQRVRANKVWDKTKGAGARVCVVDSGIDPMNRNVIGGSNLLAKQDVFYDSDGHGTAVAGVVVSVAPEVQLYSAKVAKTVNFNGLNEPRIRPIDIASGIYWCSHQGVRLILVSVGTDVDDNVLRYTVLHAQNTGALIIAAGLDGNVYPAKYPKVLSAAVTNAADNFFIGTGHVNDGYSFIAPGMDIISSTLGGGHKAFAGPEFAAAHVAGLAALYLALHPSAGPDEISEALKKAAAPLDWQYPKNSGFPSGYLTKERIDEFKRQQGYGMIDAVKLVDLP